jgi:small subunit ribosomal protein S19
MSRAKWKGPFQEKTIFKNYQNIKKKIKVWSRASVIPAIFINKFVFINKGNTFKRVLITRDHVGYKFGEFAKTRVYKKPINKNKKK